MRRLLLLVFALMASCLPCQAGAGDAGVRCHGAPTAGVTVTAPARCEPAPLPAAPDSCFCCTDRDAASPSLSHPAIRPAAYATPAAAAPEMAGRLAGGIFRPPAAVAAA